MKSRISILALIVFSLMPVKGFSAEPDKTSGDPSYKVVIEVSIDGAEKWEGVLRNVENTRKELGPKTEIEVVTHGKGVGMLLLETSAGNAELRTKLEQLSADGVVFAACENTMRRKQLERKDLVELATNAPSGVSEVVRKQAAGYAYIKSGE